MEKLGNFWKKHEINGKTRKLMEKPKN